MPFWSHSLQAIVESKEKTIYIYPCMFTGGSNEQLFFIPWRSEDIMSHQNRLIPHITPSLVAFVAAPMLNTKISEVLAAIFWYLVPVTKIYPHCSSLLTLNLNTKFIIPIATIFGRIILPFVTVPKHDSIFSLLDLYQISMFIPLIRSGIKGGIDRIQSNLRPIHGTEYFGQWNMSWWPSVEF